ncbi:hypothetical protein FRC08_011667 [Ceratobasidium sp. 394]|nr:hypothetical protein FRC08_011667 [Ceratobasidium sp. 394]
MVGKDDRKDAYIVPPEAREFVRKRDQKKCLLCGAGNTMPDPVLIVAGSPWDEIELEWLKERGLVPDAFNALHPQNIISLCPNHHELFLHRRWCFVPCMEDRHAMRVHEEHDMRDRDHRLALGHDIPLRTLPQLSGKFDFLNCAFGDEALSLTPAGGRMTLVSTMPPDHESTIHLPRPPQYPLPGVNPYVILAHAAKCVGGPRKPIFPDIEHEITELVDAYNRDPSLPSHSPPPSTVGVELPHHHSPHESGSSRNSDSHSESRSSSPTSSLDGHPPPPVPTSMPPSSAPPRARTFTKPAGSSPEQAYHTPYGINRQDTGQSHYSNNHYSAGPGGTQPIPIFRPPSAMASANPGPVIDGSPSSGTGGSIPPPPPIPHHLQPPNMQPLQPQVTGRRRPSEAGPPPVNLQQQAPPPPPPIPPSSAQSFTQPPSMERNSTDRNVFAQQSASFPQYGQYPGGAGPGAAPGLGRRPSKLRHSEDLRGGIKSPPPVVNVGPRSPDRVVSGGAGSGGSGGPRSPDQGPQRRESHSQHPRPRDRDRERDRDRDRDRDREREREREPFVFGPDISAADIISRLTEGRSSSADFSGRRRNGST